MSNENCNRIVYTAGYQVGACFGEGSSHFVLQRTSRHCVALGLRRRDRAPAGRPNTPHQPESFQLPNPLPPSQDNRYWSMYKLPMFGCTDSSQVLKEVAQATKDFPNAYVRLVAFDADRQVQVAGMLVHRPNFNDVCKPEDRSV